MVVNINSADFIQKIEEMEERIAKLEEINTVQNKHITYLQKHTKSFFLTLRPFAWYRLVVAAMVVWVF